LPTSPQLKSITTGFIGLGSQGAPMARRMVEAGFPLVLWARRPEALAAYADTPARSAASIRELGAQCEHVGICVVNDADVAEVCAELIPSMRPGSRIAIHSTIHPQSCADLERRAAQHGIALIDAPVSGGAPSAAAGTMTVMVGGSIEALLAARPVFETFATKILHLGDVGAGQKAKLLNNTLLTGNIAVAHHIMTAADELGVDRAALVDLVSASSGRSFGFDVYARQSPLTAFDHGSRLLEKDVRLLGASLKRESTYAPLRDLSLPVLARMQKT
jgi:3-hydroxyisobutyrate dehydrogenase